MKNIKLYLGRLLYMVLGFICGIIITTDYILDILK